MNAAEIVTALGGRRGLASCPAHRDSSPSLSIRDGNGGRILVHCFAGCPPDQIIAALRRAGLWPGHAAEMTEAEREAQRRRYVARQLERHRRDAFVTRTWQETWRTAVPACGSPVITWLRARGIDPGRLDLARLPLRWAPRCPLEKGTGAAMVALMCNPISGEPVGIHRTFLLPDGSAKAQIAKPRQMLGHAGIIRLSPDEEVSEGLGLSEGIENGLALMSRGWRPIWAAGTLSALTRFPVLPGVQCLTVFADPKAHEVAGAQACAERWAAAGREAIFRVPSGDDWNAVLRVAA